MHFRAISSGDPQYCLLSHVYTDLERFSQVRKRPFWAFTGTTWSRCRILPTQRPPKYSQTYPRTKDILERAFFRTFSDICPPITCVTFHTPDTLHHSSGTRDTGTRTISDLGIAGFPSVKASYYKQQGHTT